jgi:ribosome maturation factor RimP
LNKDLKSLIEPVVTGLGYDLWGMDHLTQGRHSVLKIYIDAENGIEVDDCAKVSRQLSGVLEVEDPIRGNYTLEVSSPGLDRRLYTLAQFEAFKGATIKLTLSRPFNGKRRFTGLLCGVEGDEVVVRSGDEETLFPFDQIDRANVVPEFK